MKKKIKRIFCLMLIVLSIFITFQNTAFADEETGMDKIINEGDSFIVAGNQKTIDNGALKGTSNYIFNILFSIAVVLAVAVGLILGIQFMIGSAEEQAKIKESLMPYVIGIFVVFSAFPIWKIVVKLGNGVTKTSITVVEGGAGDKQEEVEDDKDVSLGGDSDSSLKPLSSTSKTLVPEDRIKESSDEEYAKRERMVKFAELFIDAANEGGNPKIVYFKGEVDGKKYNESERIPSSFERKATKLKIFNQEPKILFDCTGFVSFIYKETTGLMQKRGYLNDYVRKTEGVYYVQNYQKRCI